MPAPPACGGLAVGGRARSARRATQLPARDVRRQGEVRMRSIQIGLGAKSTGNEEARHTRVKRKQKRSTG